jgi:class 3 adenylate cyclase/Tfp pilus assembly protein PilF
MKSTLLALIILLSISITNQTKAEDKPLSGQAKIDSLLAEIPKAKGDTNEVKLLNSLTFNYKTINPNKGIDFGVQGLKLAKEIDWEKGEAICNNSLGLNYKNKSDYTKALDYFYKALHINTSINNQKGIATNYTNIGNTYHKQSNYPKALDYYYKALRIEEEQGDTNSSASTIHNIGIIYHDQSDYPKALEYYHRAKIINEKKGGNKIWLAINLESIGIIYRNQSNYPKALEYFHRAKEINENIGNSDGIAKNLGNIGTVYHDKSDYPKALEYYHRAKEIKIMLGNNYSIAINLGNIGGLYFSLSQDSVLSNITERTNLVSLNKEINLNKSIEYTLQSINLLEEIGELNGRSYFLKNLADAYKQKGDLTKAYDALEEHHKLKDSVFNQENSDKIAALEKAREDDLKQKEIEKQKIRIAEQEKRERLILYFAIGIVVLMTVVMIVIYRLLKRSDKLLYNVLPVSIAKRLKKKEYPISDYFTQASIVFIDIVNFTEMASETDPQKLVSNLNTIFTMYDAIANKYGLEKIKTIGDSYMAAAGIPEVQKDNTHRAAQMALEVKEMMREYHTADGTKIEVRIGLDCGPVVAGIIGENKFIYDMWSDAVNTASRMESSSIAGEVHVSERFKEAVTEYEQFDYVERGEIEIKGKGKMKTYFIEERKVEVV